MKTAVLVCRVLLGLGFVVFGANIVHPFLPMPPMDPEAPTTKFFMLMAQSHWMAVIGLFQLVGGLLVLSGRMTPLGLAFLAPVLVNIYCFHVFLQHGEGLAPGLVFGALWAFVAYAYRGHLAPLLATSATPAA